ncbi:zinc fingers and homeoboxes protein 3 [Denticeps clupeoides]|uniref:zinc fingers and homeoboxes protein 3 n=1 Tax=Denticeps clupeoides TaxID=299321 RepID=UPI0010A2B10C|nr:zinc fingers and homeoboxes protein 3-like [Denticeps clupeoides]
MASKRKSAIPCMIPPKSKYREDIILGCLPELLPTIPEDSILSISGEEEEVHCFSKKDSKTTSNEESTSTRSAYSCLPCGFECRDLKPFLDHLDSSHPDFQAHPTFYCRSCGVSVSTFETLVLHNAKAHPGRGLVGSPLSTSLQITKKRGVSVVEQRIADAKEPRTLAQAGISIIKTPIMKIAKSKDEQKKIMVSHTVEVKKVDRGEISDLSIHDTQTPVINGAAGTLTFPSTVQMAPGLKTQNRGPLRHPANSSLPLNAIPPADLNNLPKVMIPLSSIPAYDSAMDSNSFLKTSFSKFPYPTKAELCYLTVVSDYAEEQIKLWFTAQRLKQGISWSPEEIEDARRKMFSTVFQTVPSGSQKQHPHQYLSQHRILTKTVATPNGKGVPRVPQGLGDVWKPGVIVSQSILTQSVTTKQPRKQYLQNRPLTTTMAKTENTAGSSIISHTSTHKQVGLSSTTTQCDDEVGQSSLTVFNIDNNISSKSPSLSSNSSNGSVSAFNSAYSNISNTSTNTTSKDNASCTTHSNGSATRYNKSPSQTNNVGTSINASTSNSESTNTSTSALSTNNTDSGTSKSSNDNKDLLPFTCNSNAVIQMASIVPSTIAQSSTFSDIFPAEGKMSQEQMATLTKSYVHCQVPDQREVERLKAATGLTVNQVFKWFSDQQSHDQNLKGIWSALQVPFGDSLQSSSSSKLGDNLSYCVKDVHSSHSPPTPPLLKQQAPPNVPHRALKVSSPNFTDVQNKNQDLTALEKSFCQGLQPSETDADHLQTETKSAATDIQSWFSENYKQDGDQLYEQSKERRCSSSPPKTEGRIRMEEGQSMMDLYTKEEQSESLRSEPKVNPIKINLKMLKVSEPDDKHGLKETSPELEGDSFKMVTWPSPSLSVLSDRISSDQLHLLRQAFASTPWPNNMQIEELIMRTGLPKSEVVRWFSDSRRIQKSGQLIWLDSYQSTPAEAKKDDTKYVNADTGQRTDDQSKPKGEKPGKGLTEDELGCELLGSQTSLVPKSIGSGGMENNEKAYEMTAVASTQDPWVIQEEKHQQPMKIQGFREHQPRDTQSTDRLRRELLKV